MTRGQIWRVASNSLFVSVTQWQERPPGKQSRASGLWKVIIWEGWQGRLSPPPFIFFLFYLCPSLFHIFWAFPAFSTPGKSVQRLNNVSPVNESSPISYEQPSSPLSPPSKSPGLSTELQSRTKVVVKVAHLNTIIGLFQTPYIYVQQRLFVLFLNVPRPPYSMLGHSKNNYARSMAEGK